MSVPFRVPDIVKPMSFLGHSFPCQRRAAYIFNKSVEVISAQDTDLVAYRYLQARQCRELAQRNWKLSLFQVVVSVVILPYTYILSLPIMLFSAPYVFIDKGNGVRYSTIEQKTFNYLKDHLSSESCKELIRIKYKNKTSLKELNLFLSRENIESKNIKLKLTQRQTKKSAGIFKFLTSIYNTVTLVPIDEA